MRGSAPAFLPRESETHLGSSRRLPMYPGTRSEVQEGRHPQSRARHSRSFLFRTSGNLDSSVAPPWILRPREPGLRTTGLEIVGRRTNWASRNDPRHLLGGVGRRIFLPESWPRRPSLPGPIPVAGPPRGAGPPDWKAPWGCRIPGPGRWPA